MGENRNITVIKDADGNKIVVINDNIFKWKQIVWEEVEKYLKQYVGEFYSIADDKEIIYIGSELLGEYAGSVYTKSLKGANAKAKANAVQVLPEMIEIARHYVNTSVDPDYYEGCIVMSELQELDIRGAAEYLRDWCNKNQIPFKEDLNQYERIEAWYWGHDDVV